MSSTSRTNLAHNNGDLVSTATRYLNRNSFIAAVEYEFDVRHWNKPLLIIQKSYSFPEQVENPTKEILVVWTPGNTLPTQQSLGPAVLTIPYYYSDAQTRSLFERVVDNYCSAGNSRIKIENSHQSPRGHQDSNNTYRAVIAKNDKLLTTYDGVMTNPPYPARLSRGIQSRNLKLAVVAAAGLVLVPVVMAISRFLRRRYR